MSTVPLTLASGNGAGYSVESSEEQRIHLKMDAIGRADMGVASVGTIPPTPSIPSDPSTATATAAVVATEVTTTNVKATERYANDPASQIPKTAQATSASDANENEEGDKDGALACAPFPGGKPSVVFSGEARVAPSFAEPRTRRSVGAAHAPTPTPPPAEDLPAPGGEDVESGRRNGTDPDLNPNLEDDDSVDRELRELLGDDGLSEVRIDDGDYEVDRLLGIDVDKAKKKKKATVDGVIAPPKPVPVGPGRRCCLGYARRPYKIGHITVAFPALFERYGYGIIGPHWAGTLCTAALLYAASYFYIRHAFLIGPISGLICVGFTIQCSVTLAMVAFRDAGVITPEKQRGESLARGEDGEYAGLPRDGRDLSDWRYCDLCSVYQPPTAAHCPDCNVCIDGYDHHCPWMGQCIGKSNMRAFMSFNISWLLYLIYAVGWVSFSPAAKKLAFHVVANSAGADDHGVEEGT